MEKPGFAQATMASAVFALSLGACSGGDETEAAPGGEVTASAMTALTAKNDGVDVCFKKAREMLGENVKVGAVSTNFSSGREIDGSESSPRGTMIYCSVEYQDPNAPNTMLEIAWDNRTGAFRQPQKMEIIPIGGDPEDFRIDDFVVPLSEINTESLEPFLMSHKDDLASIFSDFELSMVQLQAPDFMQPEHVLSVTVEGRLAANDIRDQKSARLATDGTTVLSNDLTP